MLMVGSSIAIDGNASGFSISAIVSPISNPSIPIIAHRSPASTLSTFLRPNPSNKCNSLIREIVFVPSDFIKLTRMLLSNSPRCNLPIAILPVNEE